jgi:hypothetical protein
MFYTCEIIEPMHLYKYVQSHVIILHQNVAVTPVGIISVACNKYALSTQIIVQKCMIKPAGNIRWCYHTLQVLYTCS